MTRPRLDAATPSGRRNYFARPKEDVAFIPSGSKLLDLALGGGWAEDLISNIVGDKSTGKTLLCIEAAANYAIKYPSARIKYRESEAAFLPSYAAALGMPINRVDFGRERLDTVEDMFDDLSDTARRKGRCLYILDSLDALSDREEMARDMDKGSYGAKKAKNMSEMFRRIAGTLHDAKITLMIVSQIRDNIGATFMMRKTTRSGGHALDFYASQVLYLAQLGQLKRTISGIERVTGVKVRGKLEKNKVALPFREAEFSIRFGYGIDDLEACCAWLKMAKSLGRAGVPSDYKGFLRETAKESNGAYRKVARNIHSTIETRWYEVENSFLPTHRKYDF